MRFASYVSSRELCDCLWESNLRESEDKNKRSKGSIFMLFACTPTSQISLTATQTIGLHKAETRLWWWSCWLKQSVKEKWQWKTFKKKKKTLQGDIW